MDANVDDLDTDDPCPFPHDAGGAVRDVLA